MTHFELKTYGESLGLVVETMRSRCMATHNEVFEMLFREPVRYSPKEGHRPGLVMVHFKMHYAMDDLEYQVQCDKALKSLQQYQSWR